MRLYFAMAMRNAICGRQRSCWLAKHSYPSVPQIFQPYGNSRRTQAKKNEYVSIAVAVAVEEEGR